MRIRPAGGGRGGGGIGGRANRLTRRGEHAVPGDVARCRDVHSGAVDIDVGGHSGVLDSGAARDARRPDGGTEGRIGVAIGDLASASKYGCRACMASRRDQENWLEDRLMIFLSTESDCATVTPQAVPESKAGSNSRMAPTGHGTD